MRIIRAEQQQKRKHHLSVFLPKLAANKFLIKPDHPLVQRLSLAGEQLRLFYQDKYLGLGLGGSHAFGLASQQSDVDYVVFFNSSSIIDQEETTSLVADVLSNSGWQPCSDSKKHLYNYGIITNPTEPNLFTYRLNLSRATISPFANFIIDGNQKLLQNAARKYLHQHRMNPGAQLLLETYRSFLKLEAVEVVDKFIRNNYGFDPGELGSWALELTRMAKPWLKQREESFPLPKNILTKPSVD
jgi:hypothetical protein